MDVCILRGEVGIAYARGGGELGDRVKYCR